MHCFWQVIDNTKIVLYLTLFTTKTLCLNLLDLKVGHRICLLLREKTIKKTKNVLGMIPDCTGLWGSNSGDLGSVEYTCMTIFPRFTQSQKGSLVKLKVRRFYHFFFLLSYSIVEIFNIALHFWTHTHTHTHTYIYIYIYIYIYSEFWVAATHVNVIYLCPLLPKD